MEIIICEDNNELARAASNWCETNVQVHQARSIFIPAGKTPVKLYELWEREKPDFLNGLELLQIDDVLGGEGPGPFRRFLETQLRSYHSQIRAIELADRLADLAVLGLGLNGHVAFHEPGIPSPFYSGCIRLSHQTCETLQVAPHTWGVTYGVDAFLESKAILLLVSGASKTDVLSRFLAGAPTLPATVLRTHPNVTLIADREAYPDSASL